MKPAIAIALIALLASLDAPRTDEARAGEPRDPMRPPVPEARAASAMVREELPVVSAVLDFNGKRSAIFNGHLVHEGSVVGPYTIDAVLEDGVRYRSDRLTREIHLPHAESPIKKPAAEPARVPSGESP